MRLRVILCVEDVMCWGCRNDKSACKFTKSIIEEDSDELLRTLALKSPVMTQILRERERKRETERE